MDLGVILWQGLEIMEQGQQIIGPKGYSGSPSTLRGVIIDDFGRHLAAFWEPFGGH